MRRCLATAFAISLLTAPALARADVTSWLAVGGGYSLQASERRDETSSGGTFNASIGVGSSPHTALIVGGLFRTTTHFGLGTDLGLAARFATRGFVQGDFGFALDTGVVGRFWDRGDYGRWPVQVVATVGVPFGFQLAAGAQFWSVSGGEPFARGGFLALELDLLRLTVMRRGATTSLWPNPSPAGGEPSRVTP